MKHKGGGLKRRMVFLLLLTLVPMVVVITVMFAETIASQQRAEVENLTYSTKEITTRIDKVVSGVYSVSDAFSTDERLLTVIDKNYAENLKEKSRVTVFILNALFESYNRLQQQERMDAVYVVPKDELFNFTDPNQDAGYVKQRLDALQVNAKEKTSRFFWYGLSDNFLSTTVSGQPRKDSVIIGSRRVYSAARNGYRYIHIFAVEEKKLYEEYALQAQKVGAQVYVLDEAGRLVSSTEEQAVKDRTVPAALADTLKTLPEGVNTVGYQEQNCNITVYKSELSGWYTILLAPADRVTGATQTLYLKILSVLLVCATACILLLFYLYRLFMRPLSAMAESMRQVDGGDLQAHVVPQGQAEMVRMMQRYNNMLDSVQRNTNERIQMEAVKKDLEMQVLVNQINPHFLYNTLETIVWRAGDVGRPDIGKIAASLGKLYRLSISGARFVPLEQELAHVNAYVNIQQSRYGNKVLYSQRVCMEEGALTALYVLKLMIQPIVENCFLYAVEGAQRPVGVRVAVKRKGQRLYISVTDSGVGMDAEKLRQAQLRMEGVAVAEESQTFVRRSTGIGLHNILARLRLYAGESSGVKIVSKLGWGTRVTLVMPCRNREAAEREEAPGQHPKP